MALLTLFHERRMVARDMAAQVPGVVTANGVAGTVFHLAIANGHTAFLKSVLSPPFNPDPDRLPPFLGAHFPLCWAAMMDQVEALEVLLEHYTRRGSGALKKVLTAPCWTLSPAQAAERRDDPLPVRQPYMLIYHAIEQRAVEALLLLG